MKEIANDRNKPRLEFPSRQSFIRSLQAPAFIKFALFSVNVCFLPKWLSIFIYALSQIHIFSIFVKTALVSLPENISWLRDIFNVIHQIGSVGDLWSIDSKPDFTLAVLAIIVAILSLQVFCMVYLILAVFVRRLSVLWVEKVWCIMTSIHLYVFFYPIHFIGIKTLAFIWNDQEGGFLVSAPVLKSIIIVGLLWNFAYSSITLLLLCPKIKTKNLLSSHNRMIDLADLVIKTIYPVVWFFEYRSDALYAILLGINLFYSLARDGILFWFLPYFNITLLKAAIHCNAILTVFSFSVILPKIIPYRKVLDNPSFSILIFLMICPLFVRTYSKHLQKILINILANPTKINSYHLLHHWNVCKYFSSQCRPQRPRSRVIDEHYLYYNSAISKSPFIKEIFSFENPTMFWDPKTTDFIEKHLFQSTLELLKASCQKRLGKDVLKCCLARYCSKYPELYILADDLVNRGIKKSSSICLKLSFYLIRLELFKKVNRMGSSRDTKETQEDKDTMTQSDLQKYFQMHDIYEYLKSCIVEQLRPQIKFWQNFQAQEPDCYLMLNLAKDVCKRALDVKKDWTSFRALGDKSFMHPFLIYGLYYSFVQNDFMLGDRFLQTFYAAEGKQQGYLGGNKLSMQVLYSSIRLSVSGYSSSLGRIVDCSDNIEKLLGYKKPIMLGKQANSIVPGLFPEKQDNLSSKLTACGNLNRFREVQALDQEGYLMNCRLYMTLRFLSDGDLCYYVLLYPIRDRKRVVTMLGNGKIVSFSRDFQEDLGFTSKDRANLNIFALCPKMKEAVNDFIENQRQSKGPTMLKINSHVTPSPNSSFVAEENSKKTPSQLFDKKVSAEGSDAYQRNSKDETFSFCFPPQQRQRGSFITRVNHRFILYNAKFESGILDGDTFVTISLIKIRSGRKMTDTVVFTTVNVISEQEHSDSKHRETTFQEESVPSPLPSPLLKRKGMKDGTIQSPASSGVRKSILKKGKFQEGGDDDDPDGLFFQTDENIAYARVRSKNKGMTTTVLSEEGEVLNAITTDMIDLNLPLKSPDKTLTRLVTITPDDIPVRKKVAHGISEILKQDQAKQQSMVVKANDGDSHNVDMEAFLHGDKNIVDQGNIMRVKTIKMEVKKEKAKDSGENLAKKFLQKDGQKLRQKANEHMEIQLVLDKRKYKKPTIIYNIIFGLSMLVELVLVVWLNYNVLGASKEAANSSQVLQAMFFRNYWLNLGNMQNRFWVGIRTRWLNWSMKNQITSTNKTFVKLNELNQILKTSVGNLEPELQALFYEKNINVYERNKNKELVLMSVDDSFQTIDKILDRGIKNIYKGTQLPPAPKDFLFIDNDSQFIFDNSFDDLAIVSDRLIHAVETNLFDNLKSASTNMTVFLLVSIALIGLFLVFSLRFVVGLNSEYRRFLRIFLTLSNREAKRTELILSNFYNMVKEGSEADRNLLVSDSVKLYSNLKNPEASETSQEMNKKNTRKNVSKASLKRVNGSNWILMLRLGIAVAVVLAFMLVYFIRALNEITTIEKQQRNINSALLNINRETLIGTQLQALAMDNGTSTIRHQPIFDALQRDLENLKAVNDLLTNLRDKNGQLSARQEEIFFNFSCAGSYTPNYLLPLSPSIKACNTISKGSGRVALANLLPDLSSNLGQFMLAFQTSNKTQSSILDLYLQISSNYITLIDVVTILFILSFDSTVTEYQVLMRSLEEQRTTLAWIAVGISVVLVVLLWFVVIRKLIRKVFDTKDILKLVPVKFILRNFGLKKYVEDLKKQG